MAHLEGPTVITNYGTLKTAVLKWVNNSAVASVIDEIVQVAQANIRRDVRSRYQETEVTGFTAVDGTFVLPSNLLDIRYLVVNGKIVEYITPEQRLIATQNGLTNPLIGRYTIIGQNVLMLGVSTALGYTMGYWNEFTALSVDADTNVVLTKSPDVYLWSACAVAAEYMKDYDQSSRFKGLYDQAVQALNSSEAVMRSSGSRLTQQVPNAV